MRILSAVPHCSQSAGTVLLRLSVLASQCWRHTVFPFLSIQSLSRTGIDHLAVCLCLTCCPPKIVVTFSRVESVQWLSLSLQCALLCTFCNVICFCTAPVWQAHAQSDQVDSALPFAKRVKFVPFVLFSWRLHYALGCSLHVDYLFDFSHHSAGPCLFALFACLFQCVKFMMIFRHCVLSANDFEASLWFYI